MCIKINNLEANEVHASELEVASKHNVELNQMLSLVAD